MRATSTAAAKIADKLRAAGAERTKICWPSNSYADNPVAFAVDVLGMRRLWSEQRRVLMEFAKPRSWIAVSTGQKWGKTEAYIVAALHFISTRPKAQWFHFAPKIDHAKIVLWPRLAPIAKAAYKPCIRCKAAHDAWVSLPSVNPYDETPRPAPCHQCSVLFNPEHVHDVDPSTGIQTADGRVLIAYTANKLGALGGLSGVHLAFGTDESSDVDDKVIEAIQGNSMGGAKGFFIGNPLYSIGWFANALKRDKRLYTFVLESSVRMTPNCRGRIVWSDGVITENHTDEQPIPGLAEPIAIERRLEAWRGANAIIAARIDGKMPEVVPGQLAPIAIVGAAEERWTAGLEGEGVLQVGVDVAKGTGRDYLAIAPARGRRILEIIRAKPGSHAIGAQMVIDHVRKHRRKNDPVPRVVYDAGGKEGRDFGLELRRWEGEIEIYGIHGTHPPRQPRLYLSLRDEIAHSFAAWLKTGAVPPDGELEAELELLTAKQVEFSWKGKKWMVAKVPTNEEIEKILKRHPDGRNACELSVWQVDTGDKDAPADAAPKDEPKKKTKIMLDPYESAGPEDAGDGFIDPYGGV